ncbi:MAG: outer membrane protein assembly factor BamA [bacterium]
MRGILTICFLISLLTISFLHTVSAQTGDIVVDIVVEGNRVVGTDTILSAITTRVGDELILHRVGGVTIAPKVREDVRRIMSLGLFSDVRPEIERVERGWKLYFVVKEKPIIQEVKVVGNRDIPQDDVKSRISAGSGRVYDERAVANDRERILDLYKIRGYYNATVETRLVQDPSTGGYKLTYSISEGRRVTVGRIAIEGNKRVSSGDIISVMKTREGSPFNETIFIDDLWAIKQMYKREGFYKADVTSVPLRVDPQDHSRLIVTLKVEEGPQIQIDIVGGEEVNEDEVKKELDILERGTYDSTALRENEEKIAKLYKDKGYYLVKVSSSVEEDPANEVVRVAFKVSDVAKVELAKIDIRGNKHFDDGKIRWEMKQKAVGDWFAFDTTLKEGVIDKDIAHIEDLYKEDGYFDVKIDRDIQIYEEEGRKKATLILNIDEGRRTIVELKGTSNLWWRGIGNDKLKKEVTVIKDRSYSPLTLKDSADKIVDLYVDKNYYLASVKPILAETEDRVIATFDVREGREVKIKDINFSGTYAFDDNRLIWEMETKPEFLWVFYGTMKEDTFKKDLEKVKTFYRDHGYTNVAVERYDITTNGSFRKTRYVDGKSPTGTVEEKPSQIQDVDSITEMYVTVSMREGLQYNLGDVSIKGNTVFNDSEILDEMDLKKGEVFNKTRYERDKISIQNKYGEVGHAFMTIDDTIAFDDRTKEANPTFNIEEKNKYFVDRIKIEGNKNTKDKVIRRELTIREGELYNIIEIRDSLRKLVNLGGEEGRPYFETVNFDIEQGKREDELNLIFSVKEAQTGTIRANLSVGQDPNASTWTTSGSGAIGNSNLFGNGQSIFVEGSIGANIFEGERVINTQRPNYNIGLRFKEPWLMDYPISFDTGVNWGFRVYQSYNDETFGADANFGIPVGRDDRFYIGYAYSHSIYSNVIRDKFITDRTEDDGVTVSRNPDLAPSPIRQIVDIKGEGKPYRTSSLNLSLVRDLRDRVFDPSSGYRIRVSDQLAGGSIVLGNDRSPRDLGIPLLGGDAVFNKPAFDIRGYLPLGWRAEDLRGEPYPEIWMTSIGARIRGGVILAPYPHRLIPYTEMFFVGGVNSLRGYEDFRFPETASGDGGLSYFLVNAEYKIPLFQNFLRGILFFDSGYAWAGRNPNNLIGYGGREIYADFSDLRYSAGLGLRVGIPIVNWTLGLDYGWGLFDRTGRKWNWEEKGWLDSQAPPGGRFNFSVTQGFDIAGGGF